MIKWKVAGRSVRAGEGVVWGHIKELCKNSAYFQIRRESNGVSVGYIVYATFLPYDIEHIAHRTIKAAKQYAEEIFRGYIQKATKLIEEEDKWQDISTQP